MKLKEKTKDVLVTIGIVIATIMLFIAVSAIYKNYIERPTQYTPTKHFEDPLEKMNREVDELAFRTEYLKPGGLRQRLGPIPSLDEKISKGEL